MNLILSEKYLKQLIIGLTEWSIWSFYLFINGIVSSSFNLGLGGARLELLLTRIASYSSRGHKWPSIRLRYPFFLRMSIEYLQCFLNCYVNILSPVKYVCTFLKYVLTK